MRLFLCYIKQNRRVVLASVVFIFILAVSFSLYRLPVAAVGYASLVLSLIHIWKPYGSITERCAIPRGIV